MKKSLLIPLIVLMVVGLVLSACAPEEPKTITAFCAAGAKPAVDEVCHEFEEQYSIKTEVTYGGAGEVLSQMVVSQSGDIYIAPEQQFIETAKTKGAIDPQTIRSIAYLIPVIAVQKGNPKHIVDLADLAKPGLRVAVTRQETTLLGKYAPEIFQKAGIADEVEKNIVTQAARPDSLLTMLIMDQVDAGIIWHFYQTLAPDKIEIIFLSPEQLTGIGEMQVALSTYSTDPESAKKFIDFITSDKGKAAFKKYGYIVEAQELAKYWK
jgi:molybdate transport system substrate-binding protein